MTTVKMHGEYRIGKITRYSPRTWEWSEDDGNALARHSDALTITEAEETQPCIPVAPAQPYPFETLHTENRLTRREVGAMLFAFGLGTLIACFAVGGFVQFCQWIGGKL